MIFKISENIFGKFFKIFFRPKIFNIFRWDFFLNHIYSSRRTRKTRFQSNQSVFRDSQTERAFFSPYMPLAYPLFGGSVVQCNNFCSFFVLKHRCSLNSMSRKNITKWSVWNLRNFKFPFFLDSELLSATRFSCFRLNRCWESALELVFTSPETFSVTVFFFFLNVAKVFFSKCLVRTFRVVSWLFVDAYLTTSGSLQDCKFESASATGKSERLCSMRIWNEMSDSWGLSKCLRPVIPQPEE